LSVVIAELTRQSIHLLAKKRDARVISAFTRVFDALCLRMMGWRRFLG
jgi:hypothetical protein